MKSYIIRIYGAHNALELYLALQEEKTSLSVSLADSKVEKTLYIIKLYTNLQTLNEAHDLIIGIFGKGDYDNSEYWIDKL